jgi:hypothetical protein
MATSGYDSRVGRMRKTIGRLKREGSLKGGVPMGKDEFFVETLKNMNAAQKRKMKQAMDKEIADELRAAKAAEEMMLDEFRREDIEAAYAPEFFPDISYKRGGKVKKGYKKGGSVKKSSKKSIDGIAQRGKTRGTMR